MESFLQTEDWLMFQKSLGRHVWHFNDGSIHANIVVHQLPLGKSYLYIPHGPSINFETILSGMRNEARHFIAHLRNIAQAENAIFIKMEPLHDAAAEFMYASGARLKKSRKMLQPQKTLVLDLNQSERDLLAAMHRKTRYNINLASKKDLQLRTSTNTDMFWWLLHMTAEKDGFLSHPKKYYEQLLKFFHDDKKYAITTRLFLVYHQNKAVAGAIILGYGAKAYYLHGAMNRDYRSLMAPYFMHWEIIKQLKQAGFESYDFWGIDARRWPGVTRFKLGWGGRMVEYPGAFDLPVKRGWYWLYKLKQKIW